MKKLLALLLVLTLAFTSMLSLTACGGGGDETDDGGINDNGGQLGGEDQVGGDVSGGDSSEPMLELIKDKVASFTIVSNQKDAEINAAVNNWIEMLAFYGIEAKHVADHSVNKMQDCEILIGTGLVQRDEYAVDIHDFGEKGYVIKVVNDKVVVCGGNTDSTLEAMMIFLENYLGINIATIDVTDVSVSKTLFVEKVQDDYRIKNLTVNGESIKDAYISASHADTYAYAAAQNLQAAIYSNVGKWMDIMYLEDDTSNKIKVEVVEDAGDDGFRVFVDTDGNLTFHCAYKNSFATGMDKFANAVLAKSGETLNFTSGEDFYTTNVSVVKYSDFGAKGTGSVDDFEAIIKTHEFANIGGQRVEADKGATYYIGSHRNTAVIKTDVDWKDAKFIIDDRVVSRADSGFWIFSVRPEKESYKVTLPKDYKLMRSDTNIGLTFETGVMLLVENRNKRVYIRSGEGLANNGNTQREVIVVDKDGNLDELTPLIFDYEPVTNLTAYPIDDKPILIQGGTFTTYANVGGNASSWCGYARGIYVARSNTTVYNVVHLIEKEPPITDEASKEASCPYQGFFLAQYSNNVTFDSCVMTSHLAYQHGTYDTQANTANNVTWKNCTQSDPLDRFNQGYWGVMASNYAKNLTFDGCALTRFDAHCGVYNVTIKDSEIGEIINLVGGGTCLIENTKVTGGTWPFLVRLREDYGGTWEGDLIVKNCKLYVKDSATKAYLVRAQWNEHDYGYPCYIPNIYVDGLELFHVSGQKFGGTFYIFKEMTVSSQDFRYNEVNPINVPEKIELKNLSHPYTLTENKYNAQIFADTKVTNGEDE